MTARRTLHIFVTNSYGGKPTHGHFDSRIWNATRLQPLSMTLHPLIRIHPTLNSSSSATNSGLPPAPPSPSPSITPFFNKPPLKLDWIISANWHGGASFLPFTYIPPHLSYICTPSCTSSTPSTSYHSPSSFLLSFGLSYNSTNDRFGHTSHSNQITPIYCA